MNPGETIVARIVSMGRADQHQRRGIALMVVGFVLLAALGVARSWPPPALTDTTQDIQ